MQLVGVLLWFVGALITMFWACGIRSYVRTGQGVSQQTVNQTMMFGLSLVVVPIFGFSPFHLLWMFPVSFIVGTLSFALPFSLLSVLGSVITINRRFLHVVTSRKRLAHARRAWNTVRRNASALLVADRVQRTRCREAKSDQSSSTERRLRPFSEWRGTSRLARTALLPSRHFPRIWT